MDTRAQFADLNKALAEQLQAFENEQTRMLSVQLSIFRDRLQHVLWLHEGRVNKLLDEECTGSQPSWRGSQDEICRRTTLIGEEQVIALHPSKCIMTGRTENSDLSARIRKKEESRVSSPSIDSAAMNLDKVEEEVDEVLSERIANDGTLDERDVFASAAKSQEQFPPNRAAAPKALSIGHHSSTSVVDEQSSADQISRSQLKMGSHRSVSAVGARNSLVSSSSNRTLLRGSSRSTLTLDTVNEEIDEEETSEVLSERSANDGTVPKRDAPSHHGGSTCVLDYQSSADYIPRSQSKVGSCRSVSVAGIGSSLSTRSSPPTLQSSASTCTDDTMESLRSTRSRLRFAPPGASDVSKSPTTASCESVFYLSSASSEPRIIKLRKALSEAKQCGSCSDLGLPNTVSFSPLSSDSASLTQKYLLSAGWEEHVNTTLDRHIEESQPLPTSRLMSAGHTPSDFRPTDSFLATAVASNHGCCGENFFENCSKKFVLSPYSAKRLLWDMIAIFLTIYDLLVIPLTFFQVSQVGVIGVMFRFGIVFWTSDILLSFFTGAVQNSGVEMRPRHIAMIYIKGWMPVDLLVVLPEWIVFCVGGSESSSGVTKLGKLAKVMRFIRTIRLLRIFRFTRALVGLQDTVKSELTMNLLDFGKLVGGIAILNHYLSCFWYGIGMAENEDGWVQVFRLQSSPAEYKYLTSLHWSLSQFHGAMEVFPGTSHERLYAITTAFLGLILASLFISSITNLIMRMQKLHQSSFLKTRQMLRYLNENNVSPELTGRIKRFVRITNNATTMRMEDVELLHAIPLHLRERLDVEIKRPTLEVCHLLKHVVTRVPAAQKQLCLEVLSEACVKSGGLLFGHSEQTDRMFVIVKGQVKYDPVDDSVMQESHSGAGSESRDSLGAPGVKRLKRLATVTSARLTSFGKGPNENLCKIDVKAGSSIAEMSLWTTWHHKGDCMASGISNICSVSAAAFMRVLMAESNDSIDLALELIQYATQYVIWLNSVGNTVSDLGRPNLQLGRHHSPRTNFTFGQASGSASERTNRLGRVIRSLYS